MVELGRVGLEKLVVHLVLLDQNSRDGLDASQRESIKHVQREGPKEVVPCLLVVVVLVVFVIFIVRASLQQAQADNQKVGVVI